LTPVGLRVRTVAYDKGLPSFSPLVKTGEVGYSEYQYYHGDERA